MFDGLHEARLNYVKARNLKQNIHSIKKKAEQKAKTLSCIKCLEESLITRLQFDL